jgi:hypothetical protein
MLLAELRNIETPAFMLSSDESIRVRFWARISLIVLWVLCAVLVVAGVTLKRMSDAMDREEGKGQDSR